MGNDGNSSMTAGQFRAVATERFRLMAEWQKKVDDKLDALLASMPLMVSEPDCKERRKDMDRERNALSNKLAWSVGTIGAILLVLGVLLRFALAGGVN
jgi:hypothetical protein